MYRESAKYRFFSTQQPSYTSLCANPVLLSEPSVFSTYDSNKISGHGFGYGSTIHLKAVGEYLERFVAFRSIRNSCTRKLEELNTSPETKLLIKSIILQVCDDPLSIENLPVHEFRTVEIRCLKTKDIKELPLVLFSLHTANDHSDYRYFPVRDTSGSAIHFDHRQAISGAILEFVERQSLTAMWASRRCLLSYIPDYTQIADSNTRTLLRQLRQKGEVRCHDISFVSGAHTLFVTYKANDHSDYVQFSCGAACALDWQAAFGKALIEVWQTGLLLLQMPFVNPEEYGSSDLKEDFEKANIPDFDLQLEVVTGAIQSDIGRTGTIKVVLETLFEITSELFLLQHAHNFSAGCAMYCKVFSPDFFLHMNPGTYNNNQNKWIQAVAGDRVLRLTAMPFS